MNYRAARGLHAAGLAILLLPAIAYARDFLPSQRWLESVKAATPTLPYKIGIIDCENGIACSPCGMPTTEYFADMRAALREVNLFDKAAATRLRVGVAVDSTQSAYDEASHTGTCNITVTYRFRDQDRVVYEHAVQSTALTDAFSDATLKSVLTANIKMLVLKLRREGADAQYLARAATLERDVAGELTNTRRSLGGLMTEGFINTVEGTIAVVQGVGEFGGAALEAAASPEFQSAMQDAMAQQQAEQARQQAMLDNIARDAARIEEQRRADEELRAAQARAAAVEAQARQASYTSPTPSSASRQVSSDADLRAQEAAAAKAREAEAERRRKAEEERLRLADAQRKEQEAERARRAAERQRLEEERRAQQALAEQQKKQAFADYLAAEARSIRMRALKCADGAYYAAGTAPSVKPRLANCLRVRYESRCPGTPSGHGIPDAINYYVGGVNCYSGDTREIPGRLNCPVDAVQVDVLEVTTCL